MNAKLGFWFPLNFLTVVLLTGCAVIPGDIDYQGPPPRPQSLIDYYSYDNSSPYTGWTEEVKRRRDRYTEKEVVIDTKYGQVTVDYYQRHEPTKDLIFVFPILGGKHLIESHFARYFALKGFDTAIVHRDKEFKRPEQFDHLEEIFRNNAIRDRIAIDFFEREYGKTDFGSFGISRGGINVAITAGVEPRLKYNVIALGGSHLVKVFRDSSERGVGRYRKRVQAAKSINKAQFFEQLETNIQTDPKTLAKYIDARDTLMFLGLFDTSVPIKYGMRLREQIGHPRTAIMFSGHYTGILFTQFLTLLPPSETFCIVPFDFIESESLAFYNRAFDTKRRSLRYVPVKILQLPFEVFGQLYWALWD